MIVTVLGSGTSTGVPIVGCNCSVCSSDHPRNKRLRASAYIELNDGSCILIDTSPDLRQQALTAGITRMDAVFYTHLHADHTHGIDELRTFNYLKRAPIDIYGSEEHIAHIRRQFRYIFEESLQKGGGKPELETHNIVPFESFELFGTKITPIKLFHGKLPCTGWRIGDFAYLTDVSRIPEETYEYLTGLDTLILGALRPLEHPTHFSIPEAVEEAKRIGARHTWLTHMGHDVDYEETRKKVDPPVEPAYDQLRIEIP